MPSRAATFLSGLPIPPNFLHLYFDEGLGLKSWMAVGPGLGCF